MKKKFIHFPCRLAGMAACLLLAFVCTVKADNLVPLVLNLPTAKFIGTPSDGPTDPNVEKLSDQPRPPLMVPTGVSNVALHKPVTTSDTNKPAEELVKITDGDKESSDSSVVLLHKGPQWVQIDLGSPYEIYAIVIWHGFDQPKIYHAVAVQVAEDAKCTQNVRTLFNNDIKNLDMLGVGANREYFETHEGKLIEGKGTVARYVRLYSDGSTDARWNEYTEVEVYGKQPK